MSRSTKLSLLLITGLAAVLRARGLFANTWQADEALFATWAREIAIWRDPLLQLQPVDKPPLLFYFQAIFYPLFGPVEFAARWPNWIASLLLVPLTGVLAWRLFRRPGTAVLAAALMALFPLAIQFSPTAFTDPLLTFWLVASLTAAAGQRAGWAGFLFGLALATKYQAVLFLPLLAGLGWLLGWRGQKWLRFSGGVIPLMILGLGWAGTRSNSLGLWQTQLKNFGGFRLSWSWELWPRFQAWVGLWQTAISPFIYYLLVPTVAWFLFNHIRSQRLSSMTPRPHTEDVDRLLMAFVCGYGLFHWLWAIPIWDRYLLPLLPLLALLLGRGYGQLLAALPPTATIGQFRGAFVILALLFVSAAWPARYGRFALGSFPEADEGAAEVAAALTNAPYGTVLYDHWYSWHWRYHLLDKRVFVSWFAHGEALADDLAAFGRTGPPRYLALPNTAVAQPIIRAVHGAGFRLTAVTHSDQIVLYKLIPQPVSLISPGIKTAKSADWYGSRSGFHSHAASGETNRNAVTLFAGSMNHSAGAAV